MRFRSMTKLHHVPIAPGRLMGAWVCLVAALLLWAPMWAIAWQARGMPCCTGNECPVRGHAGSKRVAKNVSAAQENAPMKCRRGSQAGLMECRMSCCQNQEQALVGAVIFVLPEATTISVPSTFRTTEGKPLVRVIAHLFEPPSPPPRSNSSVS